MFKNAYTRAKRFASNKFAQAGALTTAAVDAFAQTAPTMSDLAKTGIDNATAQGSTVGGYVIGGVAGLVVIGLIIGIVKKL